MRERERERGARARARARESSSIPYEKLFVDFFFFFRYYAGQRFIAALSHTNELGAFEMNTSTRLGARLARGDSPEIHNNITIRYTTSWPGSRPERTGTESE